MSIQNTPSLRFPVVVLSITVTLWCFLIVGQIQQSDRNYYAPIRSAATETETVPNDRSNSHAEPSGNHIARPCAVSSAAGE